MSLPGRDPADPREWLRRARSNLARARAERPTDEVLYDDLAFDAQQAAEKAIKAVLLSRGIAFPRTHSVVLLMTLAADAGLRIPAEIREAGRLTRYAVAARYPGLEDVTEEELREAAALAEAVVGWAEELVARGAGNPGPPAPEPDSG